MIILASQSPTRAELLQNLGVSFSIKVCDYDEERIAKTPVESFSSRVVEEKAKQFFATFGPSELPVLFADSCVIVEGKVLGKAENSAHAKELIELQSGKEVSVYTAMKLVKTEFVIDSLSVTSFGFNEFSQEDVKDYLDSLAWQGKAGAMSIEGMFGKYIAWQKGETAVAMGLDLDILKTFL